MDKEEISRICTEYNDNGSYTLDYLKSKDLGLMTEVIPLLQKSIPSLQAQLINLWKLELQQLSEYGYLKQVSALLPNAAVRLVGIKQIPQKKMITFSFVFNLAVFSKRNAIKVEGIPVIAFGLQLSIFDEGPSGKGKIVHLKNRFASEKFTPLKKAS